MSRFRTAIRLTCAMLFVLPMWHPAQAATSEELFSELQQLRREVEQRKEALRLELKAIQSEEQELALRRASLDRESQGGAVAAHTDATPAAPDILAQLGEVRSQLQSLQDELQRVKAAKPKAASLAAARDNLPPGVDIGGSLRLRNELKDDFNFNGGSQDYLLTQFRVYGSYQPAPWIKLYAQGQDARIFGEEKDQAPGINDKATPNIFADNFDLHQAHVDLMSGSVPAKLRLGRQKFNLGTMRLVASLEWVNTARVHDGARLTLGKAESRTLEAFASRLVPVSPDRLNNHDRTGSRMFNSYFNGLYYTDWKLLPGAQLESYWLWRHEGDISDDTHTVGLRFDAKNPTWALDGELALQFGEFGGLTHRALAAHIGTSAKVGASSRLGTAYNFGSGDKDPNDDKHQTFDNLYPLNHAYYGFMDFFSLQNIHNLEFVFTTKVASHYGLRVGYQNFWLAQAETDAWYNAGGGAVRPGTAGAPARVGSEIDLTVKRKINKVHLEFGYSHFFPGAFIEATGPQRAADFVYLLPKITF